MILKKYRAIAPLLVLICFCIPTIVSAIKGTVENDAHVYPFSPGIKHYMAFAAVAICLISYFVYRPVYKYVLLITIICGLANLINFHALERAMGLTIAGHEIAFQPAAFIAGIIAYLVNYRSINTTIFGLSKDDNPTPEATCNLDTGAVEKFKERYQHFSTEDLKQILSENRYVPEALQAAREVINERAE